MSKSNDRPTKKLQASSIVLGSFGVVAIAMNCAPSDDADVNDEAQAKAQSNCELYETNCAQCHGSGARGDGLHAQHLNPPPADLLSSDSRAKSTNTLFDLIKDGTNRGMPTFANILTDDEIRAVLDHIDALETGDAATCEAAQTDGSGGDSGSGGQNQGGMSQAGGIAGMNSGGSSAGTAGAAGSTQAGGNMSAGGGNAGSGGMTSAMGGNAGAAGNSSTDPRVAACQHYCDCLNNSCSALDKFPFASTDACEVSCMGSTDDEIACWTFFCEEVGKVPALDEHNCDHASGDLGSHECDDAH